MFAYGSQLIISISIRIIAGIWSIVLINKIRSWRIALLTIMLFLMAVQQWLRFYEVKSEVPGLVVSILAFLVTYIVGNLIISLRAGEKNLKMLIATHSEVEFSHSLCPDCVKKLYPDLYKSEEKS